MNKLSKQEYANISEEKKKALQNKVLDCAKHFTNKPESIVEYLKFQSKFYQYSTKNTMLIQSQNPKANFCGSFKFFKEKGYSILKGEKAMQVFVPTLKTFLDLPDGEKVSLSEATKEQKADYKAGKLKYHKTLYFKVGNVFDISQTDCPTSDYPKYLDLGYTSEQHKTLFNALKSYSEEKLNCPVQESAYSSLTYRGLYSITNNEIQISRNFDDTTKLSILSHELGHALLHSAITPLGNPDLPSPQREFEADAVSIMLHSRLGCDISESRQRHIYESFKEFTSLKEYKPEHLTESLERATEAFKDVNTYINTQINQPTQTLNQTSPQIETQQPILPNAVPSTGMVQSM